MLEPSAGVDWVLETVEAVEEEKEAEEEEEAMAEEVVLEGGRGPMTERELSPTSATNTSSFDESYATAKGPVPTGTVATMESFASAMTETVLSSELATKTSPLEGSYATASGPDRLAQSRRWSRSRRR